MKSASSAMQKSVLWLGDILTLATVTLIGFASHGTASSAGMRMLTTFLPLAAAWFLIAPYLGCFDPTRLRKPGQLWRPFWAMVLAAPMAAWMRGALLNAPILPIFVVILGGFAALALLVWRAVYWVIFYRSK